MLGNKMLDSACRQYPVIPAAKQLSLIQMWKDTGDKKYLDQLILSNMKLVISETHKIRMYNPNLSYDDLFQEGLSGLLKAASKFDSSKEANFATYAMWWIRAYQKRYTMDNRSLVRLGTTRDGRVMFANLAKAKAKAESLGLEGYDKIKKISEIIGVEVDAVEQMMSILSGYDSSLDTPIGEDKDTLVIDTIPDYREEHLAVGNAIEDAFSSKIHLAVKDLPDNERFIVENRFLSQDPMTFRDLAKKLKISREWVRKLEIRALERMRRYLAREYDIREI
jgi:RNA polymerase sigma-32 factor